MRLPQVLVYETDRRLATMLQRLADQNNWLLRELRQLSGVLRLFDRGGPGVLVLRLSRDVERELAMVEHLTWLHPDVAVVVIAESAHTGLAALAWDLGVRWILLPPHTRERLEEIVASLMEQFRPTMGPAGDGT